MQTYTYIYTCICMYTYLYIHIYVYMYVHIYMHIHTLTYTHTHTTTRTWPSPPPLSMQQWQFSIHKQGPVSGVIAKISSLGVSLSGNMAKRQRSDPPCIAQARVEKRHSKRPAYVLTHPMHMHLLEWCFFEWRSTLACASHMAFREICLRVETYTGFLEWRSTLVCATHMTFCHICTCIETYTGFFERWCILYCTGRGVSQLKETPLKKTCICTETLDTNEGFFEWCFLMWWSTLYCAGKGGETPLKETCTFRTESLLESSGVEPVHWKPADINPGSLKWVKIKMHFSSELIVQIKQKKVYGVETPLPRSFLGGYRVPEHICRYGEMPNVETPYLLHVVDHHSKKRHSK